MEEIIKIQPFQVDEDGKKKYLENECRHSENGKSIDRDNHTLVFNSDDRWGFN